MRVLVAGGHGGIGKALVSHYLGIGAEVWVLTHTHAETEAQLGGDSLRLAGSLTTDWLNDPDALQNWLSDMATGHGKPDLIVSCSGFLHDQSHGPEKQLSDISRDFFARNIELNCYAHITLAQGLNKIYSRKEAFRFAALSAMVGSITDNQLGGWYSYRISKAALNMFIKTLSVEWKRRYPNATAVAVHPGTTDTDLSKPFQARIAEGKLYSPQLTAERLSQVFGNLTPQQSGQLLHWDGSQLPY